MTRLRRVLTDALQYINQVSIGLDVQQLAGRQQTLNDADPLCSNFRPGKTTSCADPVESVADRVPKANDSSRYPETSYNGHHTDDTITKT